MTFFFAPKGRATAQAVRQKGAFMPEETVETFNDLDAAFHKEDVKEQEALDKEVPAEKPKTTDEAADAKIEQKVDVEIEQKDEKAKDEQPKEATGEDVWSALGHSEFSGKTEKEIAAILKQKQEEVDYHNLLYGQQSNELGTLRKKVEELGRQAAETPGPEDKPDLSGKDLEEFHDLLVSDPMGAFRKYYGPEIDSLVQKKLEDAMTSTDGPVSQKLAEQMDAIGLNQLLVHHSDVKEHLSEMNALDAPESLGKQKRPHEDIYQLAKLWKSKDANWEPTYQLMAKYPQMPFTEANAIAISQQTSQAESDTQKEKVIDQVESIKQATPKKTTKTRTEKAEVFSSVDEAWDSVPIED